MCAEGAEPPAAAKSETPRVPQWREIRLQKQITVVGGYLRKPASVEALEVVGERGEIINFVKVAKGIEWLYKACCGRTAQNGSLKRSRVLEDIADKLSQRYDTTEVARAPAAPVLDEDDPMNGLDAVEAGGVSTLMKKAATPKKSYYRPKRPIGRTSTLEMPEYCTLAHPNATRTRLVRVLPKGNRSLYIAEHDVPWLVRYMADEVSCGGVSIAVEGGVADDPLPNLQAVEGLRVEWDFAKGNTWKASFVRGPLQGTTVSSNVSKMNLEKWNVVAQKHGYTTAFENATYEDLKKSYIGILGPRLR